MTLFIWQEELDAKKEKLKMIQISQSIFFFQTKAEKKNNSTLVWLQSITQSPATVL